MNLIQRILTVISIITITSNHAYAEIVNPQYQLRSEAIQLSQDSETKQPTRKNRRSYIGLGGGLGLSGGETGLADGGISIVSRFGITDNISIHNSTIFGNQTSSMPALTIGIPIRNENTTEIVAYPFLGGGININTSQNFEVDPLLVTGVDVPVTDQIMATTRFNYSFGENENDFGVLLGIGYRF
ncbi:hypothetical protein [Synechococcus sp. PCC 6312]|uniref:hypothetical protein n=1 Tax=Synechococcus sp. (strain ATCC 27167 / PCC 6312) TaxID=195253 RepID=UPI00029F4AF4|nr:hypothetical protein [Synechococcus sp. PCC 6312]AFY60284.1 hypothetical protein Syn6312_1093 [Synechococcus sp. PCC 6312]